MDAGIELLRLDMTKWNPDILSEREGSIGVIDSPLRVPAIPGHLDARNGKPVLSFMDIAINGAQTGKFDAVVTAPVQKSTINDAGASLHTGHTEYFAEKTGTKRCRHDARRSGGEKLSPEQLHVTRRSGNDPFAPERSQPIHYRRKPS